MPKSCVAVDCTSHNLKVGAKLSFHVFPKAQERRDKWIQAVRRVNPDGTKWEPSKHAVLCGKHFIQGRPNSDPKHPDYIPTIFAYRLSGLSDHSARKLKRYESCKRRSEASCNLPQPKIRRTSSVPVPTTSSSDTGNSHEDVTSQGLQAPLSDSERARYVEEMQNLRKERDEAQENAERLKKKLDEVRLTAASVTGDDLKCKFHTGLNWDVFFSVFMYLQTFIPCNTVSKNISSMSPIDQFFVTLIKLRFGMPFQFIAERSGFSTTTIIKVFWQWIDVMHAKLGFLIKAPDHETSQAIIPPHFKAKFPRLTCIIDCFEIFIDQPKNLLARACTYSNYKKHNTVKFLIGCTPQGCVSFISQGWGGRVSDNELVRKSGFIDPSRHRPGDQILADRGFTLQEDFALSCGAHLIIPSFTKGKTQLSAREVETSRQIASVRIHIERIIGLMKNRYAMLQGTLPINVIKSCRDEAIDSKLSSVDKIVSVCAALVNLGDGIVFSPGNN